MRVLVVAATRPEVAPLASALARPVAHNRVLSGLYGPHEIDILLTGVGMVATAVWCTRALAIGGYDVALNLGICGSFNPQYTAPSAVHIVSDALPELGAEDGDTFLPLETIGLLSPDEFPWTGGRLVNAEPPSLPGLADLPAVAGITVNTVHGNDASIARVVERTHPDVESMEGAAFAFACLAAGVPFAQVRTISNRVERRNRAAWDLHGAVAELGRVASMLLGVADGSA
ncbi:MAG: futalosine hydrolase [Vicinamibacterales bacterium]